MSDEVAYFFVDMGYLRRVFEEKLFKFIGTTLPMHWDGFLMKFRAKRAFYYDCIDEERGSAESEGEFNARILKQNEELAKINSVPGFFVRLGSLRGSGKRRRQKEVDVLLAVDMLTHSHNRNMSRAVLIAGDLDFKPVVEALVQQGTLVTIVSDLERTSKDLAHAADQHIPLSLLTLWELSAGPWRTANSKLLPSRFAASSLPKGQPMATGVLEEKEVRLYIEEGEFKAVLPVTRRTGMSNWWQHQDKDLLLSFLDIEFGPISWS